MIGFAPKRLPPLRPDAPSKLPRPVHVAVIGGGLGGAAAATVLAERGARVTLIERQPTLGGRVSGWADALPDGETFQMERGFHAFFRQYYNLRRLLRRIDPDLQNLLPLVDYPVHGPGGAIESFRGLPKLPPFNVAALVRRTRVLSWRDLLRVNKRAALEMLRYHPQRTYDAYDGRTARDYLDSLGFPPRARRMLFDVFSHSFFNPEDRMSAGEMLMMFHFYFLGNPEGLVFDVLAENFQDGLWRPLARRLAGLGVEIRTSATAAALQPTTAGGWRVTLEGAAEPVTADAAVLALDVTGLQRLVAASPELGDPPWRRSIAELSLTLPFAVWRLWLDRPHGAGRHAFVGTAGLGLIDNISLFELIEGESRRWAMRSGGSVVELHAYAVPPDRDEASVKAELRARLHELYPETRDAAVLAERYLWKQDCPAFTPGAYAARPTVETPQANLALAGDLVRIPIPSALMERATASGFMAANRLLANWGVAGEEIWSVPSKGILTFES